MANIHFLYLYITCTMICSSALLSNITDDFMKIKAHDFIYIEACNCFSRSCRDTKQVCYAQGGLSQKFHCIKKMILVNI